VHDRRVVGDGVRVRHRRPPRESTGRRRAAFRVSTVSCARSRFAQVRVEVDHAGAMTRPRASIRSAPSIASGPAITPSATTTSRTSSVLFAGSTTRPPSKTIRSPSCGLLPAAAEHEVQQAHPGRDAVRDLVLDHGVRQVATSEAISHRGSWGRGASRGPLGQLGRAFPRKPNNRAYSRRSGRTPGAAAPSGPAACSRRPAWRRPRRGRSPPGRPSSWRLADQRGRTHERDVGAHLHEPDAERSRDPRVQDVPTIATRSPSRRPSFSRIV